MGLLQRYAYPGRGCYTALVLLLAVLYLPANWARGEIINREFQLKTAYLFHFAELAEWPSVMPVTICLQGSSQIREYLPALEGQAIHGQPVYVRFDQQADLGDCRILFLSDSSALTPSLMERAKNKHVLLVSDIEGFARKGGMVEFTLRDNKLKLVINLSSVKQAGLKFSSKLLRMSEILE